MQIPSANLPNLAISIRKLVPFLPTIYPYHLQAMTSPSFPPPVPPQKKPPHASHHKHQDFAPRHPQPTPSSWHPGFRDSNRPSGMVEAAGGLCMSHVGTRRCSRRWLVQTEFPRKALGLGDGSGGWFGMPGSGLAVPG